MTKNVKYKINYNILNCMKTEDIWVDNMRNDMYIKVVNTEMTADKSQRVKEL